MDEQQFDALSRVVDAAGSRRTAVRTLAGLALGGFAGLAELADGEARRRRKRCRNGKRRCKDGKCGRRCCKNGRACNVVCSGPNGNDYCCHETRPVAICGGCWTRGSRQCEDPKHYCSPGQKCCGDDHCCAEAGWECCLSCSGIEGSNSCCRTGTCGNSCCKDGVLG